MTDITELVASEIADFCAGLSSPGEPETPEEIQCQLMGRILPIIGEGLKLANQRIAELEARNVCLPEPFYPDGDMDCSLVLNEYEVIEALERVGVKVTKREAE